MANMDLTRLAKDLEQKLSTFKPGDEQLRHNLLSSARSLVATLETPRERVSRMAYHDPAIFATTRVLVDTKVFTILADSKSPKTVEHLAKEADVDATLLARLIKHVAVENFVQEIGPDEYAANQLTQCLASSGGEGIIKDIFHLFNVDHSLPKYFEENGYSNPADKDQSAWYHLMGKHYFEYVFEPGHEEVAEAFHNHMRFKNLGPKWYDFPNIMNAIFGTEELGPEDVLLVDVGGSTGHDILGFHKAHPDISGRLILQDLPATIESLDVDAMARHGVKAMPYDFFTPQPVQGAKVYYLKMVLHDWPNEQCKQILSNLKTAMKPGYSRILINEVVIPEVGAGWFETSLDMLMMKVHAAQERREREWKALVENVGGLQVKRIWDQEGAVEKIIEIDLI